MKIKITLTKNQWERISEITDNGGLLMLGSVVIPFLLERPNIIGAIWGVALALLMWYISLRSARKY